MLNLSNLSQLMKKKGDYQAKLNQLKKDLNIQIKRKEKIEIISKNMENVCCDKPDDVNKFLNHMNQSYDEALKGLSNVTNSLSKSTSNIMEKELHSDSNMGLAYSWLQSELKDVNNKIEELNNSIKATENDLQNCINSIASEKQTLLIGARNRLLKMDNNLRAAEAAYNANPSSAELKIARDKAISQYQSARTDYNKAKTL